MDSMWVLLILTNQQKKTYLLKSNMQISFYSGFTSLSCRKFIFNLKQRGEFVLDFITQYHHLGVIWMCFSFFSSVHQMWMRRDRKRMFGVLGVIVWRKRLLLPINSISVFSIESEMVPYDNDTFNLDWYRDNFARTHAPSSVDFIFMHMACRTIFGPKP